MRRAALVVVLVVLVGRAALADGLPPITASFRDGPAARLVHVAGGYPQKHAAEITAVAFSADGHALVTAGGERSVKLWDARSGHELATFGPAKGRTNAVGVLAGGAPFAASGGGSVMAWAATPTPDVYRHGSGVVVACATADGLFAAGRDGTIKRWRAPGEGQVVARRAGATAIACGGTRLLFADGAVVDVEGDAVPAVPGRVNAGAFARDGRVVVIAAGGALRLVDLDGGAPRELLRGLGRVVAVAVSADGARAAVAGGDRRVTVVDVHTGRRLVDGVEAASAELTAIALSPDGALLVTASRDTRFERWELPSGRRLPRAAGKPVRPAPPFAHHGALVLRGDAEGITLQRGRERLLAEPTRRAVVAVAFARDGHHAAAVDDAGQLTVIDVRARRVAARIAAHDGPALGLAWLPDGVLTAGDDHRVRRWDLAGHRVAELELASAATAVAASPDGARVVAGERAGLVHVWDGRGPTARAIDLRASDDWPRVVGFTRDGRRFSVGTQRGVTLVFE